MIDARDLMRLHVEALFTYNEAGRLLAVNEPDGAPAPRFFFGRTADGNAWWFRDDVDAALANCLDALCNSQPADIEIEAGIESAAPFIACLSREEPIRRTWAGPAFRFPSDLPSDEIAVRVTPNNATVLNPYLEEWRDNVSAGVPMAVVVEGGKAVSICCSVRVTPQAHEAGVETHRDFRGRGHAARAVAAWASAVREMGEIPLFSAFWENESSRSLAKRLRLIQYGVDLHIT